MLFRSLAFLLAAPAVEKTPAPTPQAPGGGELGSEAAPGEQFGCTAPPAGRPALLYLRLSGNSHGNSRGQELSVSVTADVRSSTTVYISKEWCIWFFVFSLVS